MKKSIFVLGVAVMALFIMAPPSSALTNGGFDANLDGWTPYGDVTWAIVDGDGAAVLKDADNFLDVFGSSLWQGQSIPASDGVFEFDFKVTGLSSVVDQENFLFFDALEVTLLFGDFNFFPDSSSIDDIFPLFADGSPSVSVDPSATLLANPTRGPDWWHLSVPFINNDGLYPALAPLFELTDYNFISSDSTAYIDNVGITFTGGEVPVPEPSTFILLLSGLAGIVSLRKKSRA